MQKAMGIMEIWPCKGFMLRRLETLQALLVLFHRYCIFCITMAKTEVDPNMHDVTHNVCKDNDVS